jgi:membrane associated rhomboid family serine protease
VGRLLIANIVVFLLSYLIPPLGDFIYTWFSVYPASWETVVLQPWRIITYQFLHGGFSHIFFNMLWLYFLGPVLERHWGPKKFLIFYLACGAAGGIVYPVLVFAGWMKVGILIGASGAIFGVIAATAILFPMLDVYIWGIFPVKLVFIALFGFFISVISLFKTGQSPGTGSQTAHFAHLAGMIVGAVYTIWPYVAVRYRLKSRTSPWQKKIQDQQQLAAQVDKILEKVYKQGVNSLSRREKNILKKATQLHQEMKK